MIILKYDASKVECILDIKIDTDIISMVDYAYSGFHLPARSRMQTGNAGIPTIREAWIAASDYRNHKKKKNQ